MSKRTPLRSRMTRKMLIQYFLALAAYAALLFFFVFMGIEITNSITWQPYDLLYRFFKWVEQYILLVLLVLGLLGWSVLTYRFMARPIWYLDEVIAASEKLANPGSEPILLPDGIKNIQDRLNQVREEAFRADLLAKEAEQRKNDLIVYLAHDLKTPLTSVVGYLSLLADEPQISPELRARYTQIALDKALRLEDLINEFFDITRFNLTSLTLEVESTNFSRMLEQTVSEFEPILAEKGLTWQCQIEPEITILCDRNKIGRVLDNLIRNAVSYSYPDSPIWLTLQKAPQGGVTLAVQNRGKTIPPEKLAHIFEQFYRVDSSRGSATGGAGLGLAIAKEITDLHGGSLEAQSSHESIAFRLWLPEQPSENRKN